MIYSNSMFGQLFKNFFEQMGFFTDGKIDTINLIFRIAMIAVACLLIFLAIAKGFEPYLLIPIGVGMLLANLAPSLVAGPVGDAAPGLLWSFQRGIAWEIFPPLIFLGIGATTDFGPLISRPSSLLLGAAAQFGIFITFVGALVLGFDALQAASIGIIGGADGPTAIFLSNKLLNGTVGGEQLKASIAIVAYSYMALVPIIQPPIIKALTTKEERKIKMVEPRIVSKREKILFPITVMIVVILLIPSCAPLIGMLMLGNLIKESGVVPKLLETASNAMLYIVTIILGLCVGATATAEVFLSWETLKIFGIGVVAFSCATAGGVLLGKLMSKLSGGKINPMIGAAGVSAVPMAARVVHKEGVKEDPTNFLLMHAMGPNVAGVIGSAVAAGVLISYFG